MLIERILEAATPCLTGRTIRDAVLGLSLIAVELDNGDIGLSYMLREQLPAGCSAFGFAQELIGADALKVASLTKRGSDNAQRGVGMAVLTAGTRQLDLPDEDPGDAIFGVKVNKDDVVGMIGLIPPVAKKISTLVNELIIFDEGLSKCGGELVDMISPMEKQSEDLPLCDVLIVTGTTLINNTLQGILEKCRKARDIVLVGSSTPMYPGAFKDSGVTVLAGSWWNSSKKDELFKKISLSGGISHVSDGMIKKAVRVNGGKHS